MSKLQSREEAKCVKEVTMGSVVITNIAAMGILVIMA
jgi:hypothetical protein